MLEVRFAAWDLTQVHLVDPHTGTVLCRLFPQDKAANASGRRRGLLPIIAEPVTPPPRRVGTGDYSPVPLTEPYVRVTHTAPWIVMSEFQRELV